MGQLTSFNLLGCVLCLSLILCGQGMADTSVEVFQKHLNPVFIETGSYLGSGIQKALQAGFKEVYSIELSPSLYDHCCKLFEGNPQVHLYLGDSSIELENIISVIDQQATFWLDAHYSGGITATSGNSPILTELKVIAQHPIKTHTILIDDVRLFGTSESDFIKLEEIINAIKEINPNYIFYFENGYIPNDVLVAEIR